MIGGRGAGIAAVICCDHEKIVVPQLAEKLRQPLIKIGERFGVAVHVVAVAVEHVIIHQVREGQPLELPIHIFQRPLDALLVTGGVHEVRDAASCKNILDLAHREHFLASLLQLI